MRDKRVRTITIQWILPLVVLFAAVVVMLINFSVSSKEKAREQVEKTLTGTAENYGTQVSNILAVTMGTQRIAADVIARKDKAYIQELIDAIVKNSNNYLAVYCETDGMAIVSQGESADLSGLDYFGKLTGDDPVYFYAEDDGLTGNSAIVSAQPVIDGEVKGYLLAFYDPEMLSEIVRKVEFDLNTFYALVDSEGQVMGTYGALKGTSLITEEDFWNSLRGYMSGSNTLEMVKMRLKNRHSGVAYVHKNEEARAIVYAYAGIEDWFWVIGISESYVKGQESQTWKGTSEMLMRLVVAVFIFLGIIAVINVITKIQANERNKELENKADTDLLTDLNNKVATERKIKEYIQEFPDRQALMFVLDIDNFKKINDTMGHAFGDEVLRTLGHQIRAEFRISDIIGRTGGDEFTIFLKDIKDDSVIEKEGKKVERFFRNFEAGEYVKYSATASIGAAVFPRDAKDFESLYKAADRALYIAKKRGKNQLAFYGKGNEK